MKSSVQEILLMLVRAALTGEVRDLPCLSVPWDELMEVANEQGVLALMYDGYGVYAKSGTLQMSLVDKTNLYGNVKIAERRYETQERLVEKLARLYNENGLRMMVLKGYGLSRLYPVTNHRQCSDVDIYLYGDQQRGDQLIEERWGIKVSNEHHHHTEFVVDGVLVENHYDFINVHAHSSSPKIERELKALAEKEDGEEFQIGDTIVYGMPPTLGVIFMLRHTAQHFAAMHVEIRHLVDWLLFTGKYRDQVDWELVNRVATENGLVRFMEAFDKLAHSLVEDVELNDIENRIMGDIWEPWCRDGGPTEGFWRVWWFKGNRWWNNRWKNRLVYKESLADQVWTLIKSRFVKRGGKEMKRRRD